jgi:predicted nuclease with TOPRIM domain
MIFKMKRRDSTRTTTAIRSNLARLEHDKALFVARASEARILLENCKKNRLTAESEEERELFIDAVESFQSTAQMMSDYVTELETEIRRVKEAMQGLEMADISDMKKAFEDFVLTDTSFSVKNVGMALYDYDQILESMKKFNGNANPSNS